MSHEDRGCARTGNAAAAAAGWGGLIYSLSAGNFPFARLKGCKSPPNQQPLTKPRARQGRSVAPGSAWCGMRRAALHRPASHRTAPAAAPRRAPPTRALPGPRRTFQTPHAAAGPGRGAGRGERDGGRTLEGFWEM